MSETPTPFIAAQDRSGRQLEAAARAKLFGGDLLAAAPTSATEWAVSGSPRADALAPGTKVDRYLLASTLGAGGMGIVYSAYDTELDRKVAIKFVRADASDPDNGQARLYREAQALAKLAHPNVVTIHDVGVHEGQVWIAMEFVAGQTLRAWATTAARRWPELLRVLINAGRGIAAAHAVGLVHRDLKPENVMIARDGRVRVMDFGLAHGRGPVTAVPPEESGSGETTLPEQEPAATSDSDGEVRPEVAALAMRLTQAGLLQGTPAYMAPEQWRAEHATPATDQFEWSVMAWELLYGERPFTGGTTMQLAIAVLTGDRRPPPRGRGVPGWLHRVLERGLAMDPGKRWPTMEALLTELERGRARAWLWTGMIATGCAAVLGACVAGYRSWEVRQAEVACQQAGTAIAEVWNDAARQRLQAAFTATGLTYAESTAARVIPWLDKYAEEWEVARTDACMNANDRIRAIWRPDTLDRALWCLDERQMAFSARVSELGNADLVTVRKAVSAAAVLRPVGDCMDETLLQRAPPPPAQRREMVRAVRSKISQAETLMLLGKFKEGLQLVSGARAQAEQNIDWPPLVAEAREREGMLLATLGEYDAAERTSVRAFLEALRTGAMGVAANAATNLVFVVGYRLARHGEGRLWAQLAEVAIAHAGDRLDLRESWRVSHLAIIQEVSGKYDDARALYQRSLDLKEKVLGPDHPDVSDDLNNLGIVYEATGEYAEARKLYERALALREATLGPEHPEVAEALNNLATLSRMTGKYDEARALHERALKIKEKALGPEHLDTVDSLNNIAALEYSVGNSAEARALFGRVLEIRERVLKPDHPDIANVLSNLAILATSAGATTEARLLAGRALAIREKSLSGDHPDIADSLNDLANVHILEGAYADAGRLYERALVIREKAFGREHPKVADTLNNIAGVRQALKEYNEANALNERALAIREKMLPPGHHSIAASLSNLASGRNAVGAHAEARALYLRALAMREAKFGPDHPSIATALCGLGIAHLAEQRTTEAVAVLERAVAIYDGHEGTQEGESEGRFTLARALVATRGDRSRAFAEARRARDEMQKLGPGMASELAEVDQWLAKHDRRGSPPLDDRR